MKRHLVAAAKFLVLPTVALVGIVSFAPGRAGLALRIYALVVCATALVLAVLALQRAFPPEKPLRAGRGRAKQPRRPPSSLARIELEAALGVAGSFDLHYRLVPRLRGIASGLLESRRRISLDRDAEAAHQLLGDATWSLVRPDRAAPEDRLARGIPPGQLTDVVDSLEAL